MGIAVRALEGFVGVSVVLLTSVWALTEIPAYETFGLFVSEMFPIPLALPLLAGILAILNIELFVLLMMQDEAGPRVTQTEKRVSKTIRTQATKVSSWNSRWRKEER